MTSVSPGPADGARTWTARRLAVALFVTSFVVYAMTISTGLWTTDVFGANWTSWHIATTGSPWIDGVHIPEVGHRSQQLLAIVHTQNAHTAFGRFPGVVITSLPAYLVAAGSMSTVPGSLTAAFLTSCTLVLLFEAMRQHLALSRALLVTLLFGFATPVWTVSANLMWPHTVTLLGIAGMAWASSTGRWWWAGIFGGIALWGRLHVALIVAFFGLLLGWRRRDGRIILRVGVASGIFLGGLCGWVHWMYGTWNPLGAYDSVAVFHYASEYRFDVGNYFGMWVAPDRGIFVWTPVVLLLLPALVRAWRELPDWTRSLAWGGLSYTLVESALNTFTGGDGFYGYRYGLEFLACATPALALSAHRVGRVARVLIGPVLAVQAFAFLLGGIYENLYLDESVAWHQNAFVHTLDQIGPAGWVVTAVVAAIGLVVAPRISSTGSSAGKKHRQPADEVSV